ncbi:Lrp/AsnC family transcriptional regulator [Amaricoccus sp.]|uniref:Lrp/AsnC family transcriptional regulator n=1 Tax=Amaricoccus sp. TaxID=1872485 RepID=UPI002633BA04|nr:Lrp/AsnC family transcriptional regulator [Amaricoccus sp.]HRO13397.1 Lrp/AsnC family transcriptional regulator [Amaricoccus sp.]
MPALDDLDRQLIALLRNDGRLPAATLARQLGVSRGTVQNRIDRLLAGGVILGFTLRLASEGAGAGVRAIMAIEVRSADTRAVLAALRRMPEVGRVHSTNGRWDLVAELATPDLAALDRALTEIRALKAVANSETSILLAELK